MAYTADDMPAASDPVRVPAPPERTAVFGHRGARGHAPENTLLAFRLALALGADGIECDVQLSADGELLVIHDATLNRTTNGRGPVALRTLAELRALDAGWGERIPTLAEVLALCGSQGRLANLEVKAETAGRAEATAEAMVPVLAALDDELRQRVLVSSFQLSAVAYIKRCLPWLRVATLHGGRQWRRRDMLAAALDIGAEAIHPGWRLLTPELVRRAHEAGLRVNVWTANRWSTLRLLLAAGVDGVFSDYPERAIITRMTGGAGEPAEPGDEIGDQSTSRM
jgi:glycerophosphoryl diester phosphodiesterase